MMSKKSEKLIKILKYFGILLTLLGYILIYLGFNKIKEVRKIHRDEIKSLSDHFMSQKQIVKKNLETKKSDIKDIRSESPDRDNTEIAADQKSTEYSDEKSVAEQLELFKDRPYVNTCTYLDGQSVLSSKIKNNANRLKSSFEVFLKLDSSMGKVFFQMSLPASREIAILDYENKYNISQDIQYIKLLYQSKQELEQNLAYADLIQLRAYYTLSLGRIILERPELIGDSQLTSLCQKIQNLNQELNRDQLNAIIYEYLDRAQVKASEIKFNPNYQPHLEVKWSGSSFNYHSKND